MSKGAIAITLRFDSSGWKRRWRGVSSDVAHLIAIAEAHPALSRRKLKGEVAIVLADDSLLQKLNFDFRGKNKPTNVLSFPDDEAPYGGMALSIETILREADAQKKTFVNHSKHMILHGFLHLAGYDHVEKKDAILMEKLEVAILEKMGIANPYLIKETVRA